MDPRNPECSFADTGKKFDTAFQNTEIAIQTLEVDIISTHMADAKGIEKGSSSMTLKATDNQIQESSILEGRGMYNEHTEVSLSLRSREKLKEAKGKTCVTEHENKKFMLNVECGIKRQDVAQRQIQNVAEKDKLANVAGEGISEVQLDKNVQKNSKNVILYRMEEDKSRIWSRGDDLQIMTASENTGEPLKLNKIEDIATQGMRLRKVKLYRRAESENLVSYLQGNIRRLERSASVTSVENRQVIRMRLQGDLDIKTFQGIENLVQVQKETVSSVHEDATTCLHQQVTRFDGQEESYMGCGKNSENERSNVEHVWEIERQSYRCLEDFRDVENNKDIDQVGPFMGKDVTSYGGVNKEGTVWETKPSENIFEAIADPPTFLCAESDKKGCLEGLKLPVDPTDQETSDQQAEERSLSVADARRAFETAKPKSKATLRKSKSDSTVTRPGRQPNRVDSRLYTCLPGDS